MSQIFYDGNFHIAQVAGPPEFEIPFKDDPKPYLYKLPYWQFLNDFENLPLGTPGPLGGTYVGGAEGTFKSVGGGVIEFRREFALVPDSRSEFESFVYNYHLVFFYFGLPDFCTQSTPLLVHSRIQLDYFRTDTPSTIDLPRAPQILSTCLGNVMLGTFPTPDTPSGTEVLAEDATFKRWRGNIYQRQMRFIRWISPADLIFGGG